MKSFKIDVVLGLYKKSDGELKFKSYCVRVPPEIKVLSRGAVEEIMKSRFRRIRALNKYIMVKNRKSGCAFKFAEDDVRDCEKAHVISWSPIIETRSLSFIISEL